MNPLPKIITKLDNIQRSRRPLAFTYAVIKKFGDDQAGYQAALVTYYGFLSIFPLLLILTTVANIVSSRDPQLGVQLVNSVSNYFPSIGQSLQESVRPGAKTGVALIIGVLLSLYGARGIADAFRNAVNHIWHVPLAKRAGFPRNLLRSLGLIFGAGGGFILATTISGWAAGTDRSPLLAALSFVINVAILYLVFMLIFRLSLPFGISNSRFRLSAAVCAVGLALLQLVGAAVLANITPKSYSAVFTTTLGLLAWLYLQARIVMYAVVANTVKDDNLWPRSLDGTKPTPADKKVTKRLSR